MPDVVVAGYLGVDIAPGFAARGAVPFSELFRTGKLIETLVSTSPSGAWWRTPARYEAFGWT